MILDVEQPSAQITVNISIQKQFLGTFSFFLQTWSTFGYFSWKCIILQVKSVSLWTKIHLFSSIWSYFTHKPCRKVHKLHLPLSGLSVLRPKTLSWSCFLIQESGFNNLTVHEVIIQVWLPSSASEIPTRMCSVCQLFSSLPVKMTTKLQVMKSSGWSSGKLLMF